MADKKPPKIKGDKPKADSEDRFPNPRSWMLWALGIFMVAMLFQVGKTANSGAVDKVDYATLQGWISSGVEVKGYIEHPPPNASVMCTITGYRDEGGKRIPFSFEDKLDEAQEKFLKENAGFQSRDKNTLLMGFLVNLLPILLIFLLIWFVLIRQIRSAGRGAMNFGKSKARMLNKEKNKITFKDVAGVDEACEEVSELVEFLKDPKKFQKLGGRIPKGVLMVGAPGTGKTLLAKAIAGEAEAAFFSISGSDFVEMFVGVGASRVRDLFQTARKLGRAIIFVDEIDSIGRKRGAGLGGGHDEREQTLNQMLAEMDGFEATEGIVMMAATNRPDILDPALLRPGRFDRQVIVPLPEFEERAAILRVHAQDKKVDENIDLDTLAKGTPGMSGADLANLVNEAALHAVRSDRESISQADFEAARDRVLIGQRRESVAMTDREKEVTAYHEGGHALIATLFAHADPVHKVTILPTGQALGVTMQLPEERHAYSQDHLEDRLAVLFGGRMAEDTVFGVRSDLVMTYEPQPAGSFPEGFALSGQVAEAYSRVDFDLVLAAE